MNNYNKNNSKIKTKELSSKVIPDRVLFFDAGPLISLVMSRMVFILPLLKQQFNGKFYITPAVQKELIERPLKIRRFGFEALQVQKLVREGVLEVYDKVPREEVNSVIDLANNSFKINSKPMDIIQSGEIESAISALKLGAPVVIDERTLRLFIEKNSDMKQLLERRFKKKITADRVKMNQFSQKFKNLSIIRSVELVGAAYKLGYFDSYLPKIRNGQELLVDLILWTTKYNGCAVTDHEIESIKDFLLKNHY
ncbi:MAG TPA: hypothetical protein VJC39_04435 [Candidatus Nanoarchaeia archaeon]|nr:hypothetical protein [Candidatus Nanoarchaeia archaeon]